MKCKVRFTRTVEIFVEGETEEEILNWMMQTTPEGAYLAADGGGTDEYNEEIVCVVDDNSMVDYIIKDDNKTNNIKLLINHYIGDDYNFSRQTSFLITRDCLKEYLEQTEDDRMVGEFLVSYDSDEAQAIYDYASDDNRILSEEITYCDDFIEKYNDYIDRMQMLNPNMTAEQITTKESYYWNVYCR